MCGQPDRKVDKMRESKKNQREEVFFLGLRKIGDKR
jgi:hypothetical protein